MESHTAARTSIISSLPSAPAAARQWGRTTCLQPMAPGTQSASSARWASLYLRPHTQLWLTHQLHTKWELDQHICFIYSISATRLMKTLCPNEFVAVDMMQINQRQPSMWLSSTFCLNSTSVCSIWSKTIQCASPSLTDWGLSSCHVLT